MGEMRNSGIDINLRFENLKARAHLGDIDVDGRVIVTSISKKQFRKRTHSIKIPSCSPEFGL
jgi:hypothetical protein